ncbi:MAG: YceI family protein [Planctomycetota bacterium]
MRRRQVIGFAAIPVLPVMAAALWIGGDTTRHYRILASRSRVEVRVPSEGQIHNGKGLVLLAHDVKGAISFDPVHPDRSRIEFRVPVRGLEPFEPRMTTTEADYVLNFLRSTWVLDVQRWPEISFIGSGVQFHERRGSGYRAIQCPGQLEIHGRKNPATLDAIARITSEGIEVSGRRFVRQRDFGIIPLKDMSAVYKIKEEVEVTFRVFATPVNETDLTEEEAQKAKLTERAEKSGELKGRAAPAEPMRPEPEVKTKAGELTKPELQPK